MKKYRNRDYISEGQVPSEQRTAHLELDASFVPEMQLCAESVHRGIRAKRCGYQLAFRTKNSFTAALRTNITARPCDIGRGKWKIKGEFYEKAFDRCERGRARI